MWDVDVDDVDDVDDEGDQGQFGNLISLHYVASSNATAGPTQQACQPASLWEPHKKCLYTSPPVHQSRRTPPSHHHANHLQYKLSRVVPLQRSLLFSYCTVLYSPLHTHYKPTILPPSINSPQPRCNAIKAPQLHHRKLHWTCLICQPCPQHNTQLLCPSHHPTPPRIAASIFQKDTPDHVRYMQQRLYK